MNERILRLRRFFGLTQQKFADRLGIKRNTIANYEINRNEPSASVVALICREFNVNEEWLRTGEGEMFVPGPSDALEALMVEFGANQKELILIERFLNLKPESRQAVLDYIMDVAAAMSDMAEDGEEDVAGTAARDEAGESED